jgi:hypothetical protein
MLNPGRVLTRAQSLRHAWCFESGQMVIFGPVLDSTGCWGLGVVEADDYEELRAFAAVDPVVGQFDLRVSPSFDGPPPGASRPRPTTVVGDASWRAGPARAKIVAIL